MEVKALECPSCGGSLNPKPGEVIVKCEFCGKSVSIESERIRNRIQGDRPYGVDPYRTQEEIQQVMKARKTMSIVSLVVFMVIFVVIIILFATSFLRIFNTQKNMKNMQENMFQQYSQNVDK